MKCEKCKLKEELEKVEKCEKCGEPVFPKQHWDEKIAPRDPNKLYCSHNHGEINN